MNKGNTRQTEAVNKIINFHRKSYIEMTGTILENLSTKKLSILVASLLVCQFICFLIGGLIGTYFVFHIVFDDRSFSDVIVYKLKFIFTAPIPASVQSILGTVCDDVPGSYKNTSVWLYSRGVGQCSRTIREDIEKHDYDLANHMVFVFQVCCLQIIFCCCSEL